MSENEKNTNEIPVEVKPEESNIESVENGNKTKNESETSSSMPEESEIEPIEEETELQDESKELTIIELKELLSKEKQNLASCEDKLKRSLADFQNLERKTKSNIENGVNAKMDQFLQNFLSIYDDFVRAKNVLADENVNVKGLESILKNMDSLLSEYGVTPINALGEIFDPNLHEAISVVEDPSLDDGTITKEIRKGYISQNRVIRPTIVEISKKSKSNESEGE